MRNFEQRLSSLCLRPFDDGRFIVLLNGTPIYDKERTGRFPNFEQDIKPKLSAGA